MEGGVEPGEKNKSLKKILSVLIRDLGFSLLLSFFLFFLVSPVSSYPLVTHILLEKNPGGIFHSSTYVYHRRWPARVRAGAQSVGQPLQRRRVFISMLDLRTSTSILV